MTKAQTDAITSYITAVVRIMGKHGDHSSNVRLMLDSKKRLEDAFGQTLPTEYADLLKLSAPSNFQDLL